jgi:hypothetical protein
MLEELDFEDSLGDVDAVHVKIAQRPAPNSQLPKEGGLVWQMMFRLRPKFYRKADLPADG